MAVQDAQDPYALARAKGGRPRRAGARATVKIQFRVTPEERAKLAEVLEASSAKTLSDLIRSLLAGEAARLEVLS